jgi:fructose-1,6-bisphosphatase/inositol monophosphatase family enzyme
MVSSKIHHEIDLSAYPGKARGIGTAALHFCLPLIFPDIVGALQHSRVFVWDIAGAHAINRAHGMDLEYWSGAPIDYAALIDGSPAREVVVSGSAQTIRDLRRMLRRR